MGQGRSAACQWLGDHQDIRNQLMAKITEKAKSKGESIKETFSAPISETKVAKAA